MITNLFNHDENLLGVIIEKMQLDNTEQLLIAFKQNETYWIAKKMQLKPGVTLLTKYEAAKQQGALLSDAEANKRFSLDKEGQQYNETDITNH